MSALDRQTVVVCIDFKQPRAYLAHRATRTLEDELRTDFDWQPFIVPALKPPPAARTDEDRGTMHRRLRAQYNERDLLRYARRLGLPLRDPYRDDDSTAAALGLLWCRVTQRGEVTRRYVDAVFTRRWAGSLDLGSVDAIAAVIGDLGGSVQSWRGFATGDGAAELAANELRLRGAGVFDVPTYLLDGEVFLGRQHLPMLRWMLTGREGEPPL